MCLLGTFSQWGTVSEHSCVKIDDDLPMETVALVGCGVPRAGDGGQRGRRAAGGVGGGVRHRGVGADKALSTMGVVTQDAIDAAVAAAPGPGTWRSLRGVMLIDR
jgi:alcohol dehydrogenase (nicotinoprotein)